MKKTLAVITIFVIAGQAFPSPVEISSAVDFSIPVDEGKCVAGDISSVKSNYGLKLNLKKTSAAANAKLPSTKIGELKECTFMDFISKHECTFGLSHSEKFCRMGINFFAGNLKYSAGISRLKSPAFSCPPPLKGQPSISTGTSPSLPSSTSAKTPLSFAATLNSEPKGTLIPSLQFAILENGEKYVAIHERIFSSIVPETIISFTGGSFFHGNENETSWFQSKRTYRESDFLSGEFTVAMLLKNFRTSSSAGIHENPFGGMRRWCKNQTSLNVGKFALCVYLFDCDHDLITASGSIPKIERQVFISPQIRFSALKGIGAIGATVGETDRKTKKRVSSDYSQYHLKIGTSYTSINFNLKGNYATEFSTETMKQNSTWGIFMAFPVSSAKLNSSFTYSTDEGNGKTFKIAEKLHFAGNGLESIGSEYKTIRKEESNRWNLDVNATFAKKTKRMKFRGKVNFSFRKIS